MKKIVFVLLLLVLLCAGCVEQKDNAGKEKADINTPSKLPNEKASIEAKNLTSNRPGEITGPVTANLSTAIIAPKSGDILTGTKEVNFDSVVKGGKGPYEYSWTSNIDSRLSPEKSFRKNATELSKGEHTVILKVTDSSGNSAQSTGLIRVM